MLLSLRSRTKIPASGVDFIGFYEDDLLYVEGSSMVQVALYTPKRSRFTLPESDIRYALRSGQTFFLWKKGELLIAALQ